MTDPFRPDMIERLAQDLLRMPDVTFHELVDADTRNKSDPRVALALRSSLPVLERWYDNLLVSQKSVESQIAARTSDFRAGLSELKRHADRKDEMHVYSVQFNKWKAGAERFKGGCEERLIEVRGLLRHAGSTLVTDRAAQDRDRALERVRELETAISNHRSATILLLGVDEATEADAQLWSELTKLDMLYDAETGGMIGPATPEQVAASNRSDMAGNDGYIVIDANGDVIEDPFMVGRPGIRKVYTDERMFRA